MRSCQVNGIAIVCAGAKCGQIAIVCAGAKCGQVAIVCAGAKCGQIAIVCAGAKCGHIQTFWNARRSCGQTKFSDAIESRLLSKTQNIGRH